MFISFSLPVGDFLKIISMYIVYIIYHNQKTLKDEA
jgi:hypothetical protein